MEINKKSYLVQYIIGAFILYPSMFVWALNEAWSGSTTLQFSIMWLYLFAGLLVLAQYFYTRSRFLLMRVCIYLFSIIIMLVGTVFAFTN